MTMCQSGRALVIPDFWGAQMNNTLPPNRYQVGFCAGSRKAKEEAQGEVEKLRAALQFISDCEGPLLESTAYLMQAKAREALGE